MSKPRGNLKIEEAPIGREVEVDCPTCEGRGDPPDEQGRRCPCNGSGKIRVLKIVVWR